MSVVYRSDAAREDFVAYYVHRATEAGDDIADRFLTSAESTFNLLAGQPLIGSPLRLQRPADEGIRQWRIGGFDNMLGSICRGPTA